MSEIKGNSKYGTDTLTLIAGAEKFNRWMYETINETLKKSFFNHHLIKKELKNFENEVLNEKISSFVAAKDLLTMYFDDQSINNKYKK